MTPVDLIQISRSPWDMTSMFGYRNGDLGIVLSVFPEPHGHALPSIRVFIFISEKIVTIPTMYATKIGE